MAVVADVSAVRRGDLLRNLVQALLHVFVVAQMRSHQALPELAVVRDGEVKEFVDDHVVIAPGQGQDGPRLRLGLPKHRLCTAARGVV